MVEKHNEDAARQARPPANESSSDDEAFERALRRGRRLRRIGLVLIAGLLLAGGAALALYLATRPDPLCTRPEDVDFFVNDRSLPFVAVGEVCHFPAPLDDALDDALGAPPQYQEQVLILGIADSSLIRSVCPHGMNAIMNAVSGPPGEASGVFLAGCALDDSGLDLGRAKAAPFERSLVAVAVYAALRETEPRDAVRLANRVIAGP